MHPKLLFLTFAAAGLTVGCGHVSAPDDPTATQPRPAGPAAPVTTAVMEATSVVPTTVTVPPLTTTARRSTTTTARSTTITLGATTTTRPLTRAEATSRLCTGVASADASIQQGKFVQGGLRLSSAIGANEKVADPAVEAGARAMLRAGLNGDAEAYVVSRQTTSSACAQAGYPINLSGPIQCLQGPCP